MAARSPDVLVVGAGIIGATCAFQLAASGRSVLVVERGSAWAVECTGASAGLICPSHATPLSSVENIGAALKHVGRSGSPLRVATQPEIVSWLARFAISATRSRQRRGERLLGRLADESYQRLSALDDAGVVEGFSQRGILYIHRSERALARAVRHARSAEAAHAFDLIAARELGRFVGRSRTQFAGALFYPGEAHCEPTALTRSLGAAAERLTARALFGEEVRALRVRRSTVEVTLRSQVIRAGSVVVCAGTASRELIAPLGLRLPLLPGRGYAVDVVAAPLSDVPVFLYDERVVATPFQGTTRLSGTLELVPPHRPVDYRRVARVRAAGELVGLPASAQIAGVRAGFRPCLPDGLPAVGALCGLPNVVVATGHAMLGLALAPATAEIVLATLDERPVGDEALALAPTRFDVHAPTRPMRRRALSGS